MPLAALPVVLPWEVAATAAVSSASVSEPILPAVLHACGQGARMQTSVSQHTSDAARSPTRQFNAPRLVARSFASMPMAFGVDPAVVPYAGMLTSHGAPASPPPMHAMMGGHGMVYVPGYCLVPIAPCVLPSMWLRVLGFRV